MTRRALSALFIHRGRVALSVGLLVGTYAAGLLLMGTSSWLIATAALQPSIAVLQVAIVGVRAFGISRGLLRYLERLVSHDTAFRVMAGLRLRVFDALAGEAPAALGASRSGDVLTRLVDDVESLELAFVRIVAPAIAAAVGGAMLVVWMSRYSVSHAVLAGLALAAAGLVAPWLAVRASRGSGHRSIEWRARLQTSTVDAVQGRGELIALGESHRWQARIDGESLHALDAQRTNQVVQAGGGAIGGMLGDLSAVALLALTIPLVRASAVDGVQVAVVTIVTLAAFELVAALPQAWQGLEASRAAAGRVFATIGGQPVTPAAATRVPDVTAPTWQRIEVTDLSFTYPSRPRPAVRPLSFSVSRGQIVALVGPSGSGKSTVAALLVRWLDPPSGSISIDGRDLLAVDPMDVRRHVALVSQRVHLFSGTVRENLLIANVTATDAMLWTALERAALADVVRAWPDQLDTWVGAQGHELSGGERQRLALARALLTEAEFLVLDEPTSYLDEATEARVCATVAAERAYRGVLLITHRPSTAAVADRVIVLA